MRCDTQWYVQHNTLILFTIWLRNAANGHEAPDTREHNTLLLWVWGCIFRTKWQFVSAIETSYHFHLQQMLVVKTWINNNPGMEFIACKDPDVSDEWSHCNVWTNLFFLHCHNICSTGDTILLFPLCLSVVSKIVRQDMTKLLRAFFFPFSMRSSSQQKPGLVPCKQWRQETGPGTGRVRYDWSFDIRVLRQHKVSFEVILVIESKYEAL